MTAAHWHVPTQRQRTANRLKRPYSAAAMHKIELFHSPGRSSRYAKNFKGLAQPPTLCGGSALLLLAARIARRIGRTVRALVRRLDGPGG